MAKAELFDQFAVTEKPETVKLTGGEPIRYLKTVKQAFLEFLNDLEDGQFYSFGSAEQPRLFRL